MSSWTVWRRPDRPSAANLSFRPFESQAIVRPDGATVGLDHRQILSNYCRSPSQYCRKIQTVFTSTINGSFISGISVAHHTARRVIPKDASDPAVCVRCSVATDHHAGMLRKSHTHTAAMMD